MSAVDQNSFTEWHSRYRSAKRGVLIYWTVDVAGSMAVHSQLISCSASEVHAMVEGALRHGTDMGVEQNFVDSHGAGLEVNLYSSQDNLTPMLNACIEVGVTSGNLWVANDVSSIPAGSQKVAGYVTGSSGIEWTAKDWARFATTAKVPDFSYRPFYPEGVPVIQVDVRGERNGRRVPVQVPLAGTVKDTVDALLPTCPAGWRSARRSCTWPGLAAAGAARSGPGGRGTPWPRLLAGAGSPRTPARGRE